MTTAVLLFGPGLSRTGESTNCLINGDTLRIDAYKQKVALSQVRADVGGFDHDQLQLHWSTSEGDFMLSPVDKITQKSLINELQGSAVKDFGRWKVATKSQSAVWNTIVYGFATIVLVLIVGIWRYDDVLTFAANRVPIETEVKIGNAVLASIGDDGQLLETGPAVEFVKKVGNQLTEGSAYQYQWYVSRSEDINAYAMPGGIVVVNAGLIEAADTAEEVAAVLAHEVQHVEQRHSLKNMLHSAGMATVVMLVLGDANAAVLIIAHKVSTQFFSRHVEAEADLTGLDLLTKHQISGAGMASFFKKLAKQYPEESNMPEWVSSHPDTQKRILAAEAYVKQHPCQPCNVLTWDKPKILSSLKAGDK